ncbi:MAG: 1,6-anhydro-N-acetylmuramyl-L-alanine amidase AmpD [Burkholderiales bacterium]|nr:1,6-anhydro-N-acetylmuramyl-L-alanine amidase AmpD [Burkholderiales bacterium]
MPGHRFSAASRRWRVSEDGWLDGARRIDSPNCDERPDGAAVALIVIHGISLPPGEFGGDEVERLFTNALDPAAHPYFRSLRGLRVSAHFFVRRDGELLQFVSCLRRAWHAGVSCWRGRRACNDYSVGIEFEGSDDVMYEDAQYQTGAALISTLRAVYPIQGIAGHCHVAPGRKTDPGASFDWSALDQPSALFKR